MIFPFLTRDIGFVAASKYIFFLSTQRGNGVASIFLVKIPAWISASPISLSSPLSGNCTYLFLSNISCTLTPNAQRRT